MLWCLLCALAGKGRVKDADDHDNYDENIKDCDDNYDADANCDYDQDYEC